MSNENAIRPSGGVRPSTAIRLSYGESGISKENIDPFPNVLSAQMPLQSVTRRFVISASRTA